MYQKNQHNVNITTVITCLIITLLLPKTSAYSSYAGSCNAGGGVGATHLYGDDTGPLSKAGFEVLIDDDKLVEETSKTIAISNNDGTSSQHKLTIRSDGSGKPKFRGFLIRVSNNSNDNGDDADMSQYLSIYDGYENSVQIITDSLCRGLAAGATHVNNNQKDEISTTLSFNPPIDALLVEVTMVTENIGEGNDGWYYSGFDVTVVEAAEEQESEEPSASPTVTKSINSALPTTIKGEGSDTPTTTSSSSSSSSTSSLTPSTISSLDPTIINPTTSPSTSPTAADQGVVVTTPSPTSDSFMISCVFCFVLSGMGALFALITDII